MKIALEIFKKNFSKIFIFSLMILLPVFFIQEVVVYPIVPKEMTVEDSRLLWYMLFVLMMSLFTMLYDICVIRITCNYLELKNESVSEIMGFSLKLWPKAIVTSLLYSLSVAFGMMLFFIPGIILFVAYYLHLYILVKTGLWARQGLFVSHFYAKANMLKITLISIGVLIIGSVLSKAISALQSVISNTTLSYCIGFIFLWIIQTVFSVVNVYLTVYVFNTKIDFDINVFQRKRSDNNAEY